MGKENGSTDEILAKLTNQGVIDDLIGALRGTGDYRFPIEHVKEKIISCKIYQLEFLELFFILSVLLQTYFYLNFFLS